LEYLLLALIDDVDASEVMAVPHIRHWNTLLSSAKGGLASSNCAVGLLMRLGTRQNTLAADHSRAEEESMRSGGGIRSNEERRAPSQFHGHHAAAMHRQWPLWVRTGRKQLQARGDPFSTLD
jgi:hypothetical protein